MNVIKVNFVFILAYFQILSSYSYKFEISFIPQSIRQLSQWQTIDVAFNISLSNDSTTSDFESQFNLKLQTIQNSQYPRKVIQIIGEDSYYFNVDKNIQFFSSDFKIQGLFLGYSNITFEIFRNESLVQILPNYSVSVIRKTSIFDTLFGVIIISLVTINYVNMGCHFDYQIVKKALKTPIGPLIGFMCQFTVMPLVSFESYIIFNFINILIMLY
jgi:hypothetical protein